MITKNIDLSNLHAYYKNKFWDIHYINIKENHITICRPIEGMVNLQLDSEELQLKLED